jgi:hypothetical protein
LLVRDKLSSFSAAATMTETKMFCNLDTRTSTPSFATTCPTARRLRRPSSSTPTWPDPASVFRPGINDIKLFLFVDYRKRQNKLECLYLAITFKSSLTFAGNTRNARRKHLKGPSIGFALALPSNSKTRLERVSKGKPSSLWGLVGKKVL